MWGPQDDNDSIAAVHASFDAGVNFFDTAEGYSDDSNSEEVLGRALMGRRADAVIATKIGNANLHPSVVAEHCDASLAASDRLTTSISTRSTGRTTTFRSRTRWPSCSSFKTAEKSEP